MKNCFNGSMDGVKLGTNHEHRLGETGHRIHHRRSCSFCTGLRQEGESLPKPQPLRLQRIPPPQTLESLEMEEDWCRGRGIPGIPGRWLRSFETFVTDLCERTQEQRGRGPFLRHQFQSSLRGSDVTVQSGDQCFQCRVQRRSEMRILWWSEFVLQDGGHILQHHAEGIEIREEGIREVFTRRIQRFDLSCEGRVRETGMMVTDRELAVTQDQAWGKWRKGRKQNEQG